VAEAQYRFYIDWNDDGDFSDSNEDVTDYVAGRDSVDFEYGRDGARALSAIQAGETAFDLYNFDGRFSPDNTGGPLYGLLVPGRRVKVEATFESITYVVFRGYIDGYEILPGRQERVVRLSVLDLLSKFAATKVSTDLYPSLQTGEAVNILLDAIMWEGTRDIDSGATTLRWWAEAEDDALTVMQRIIEAEGPPAVAYVEGDTFIFRDRHHRLIRTDSSTSQATFRAGAPGDAEPHFCEPMTYNIGWKDLANRVETIVEEKLPDTHRDIYQTDDFLSLAAGESRLITIDGSEPFLDAVPPQPIVDYTIITGTATFGLTRLTGKTTTLTITANTACVIQGLRVRARPLIVRNSVTIIEDDVGSQDQHGIRTVQDTDFEGISNQHDGRAVARILIGQRSERLPVVSIGVNSGNSTRLTQVLERRISDRIHIIEPDQTFVDHDFYIDRIEQSVDSAGKDHRAIFICERVPVSAGGTPIEFFTFGSASAGFNEGYFADPGTMITDTLFILDDATQGQLGVGGLGW
jgi:hypothetical protein